MVNPAGDTVVVAVVVKVASTLAVEEAAQYPVP